MIDVVGTLNQFDIFVRAVVWGFAVGAVCAVFKLLFNTENKIVLVVSDIFCSTLFGLSCIAFSLLYSQGIVWLYEMLAQFLGTCAIYFSLRYTTEFVKKRLKRKRMHHN